MFDLAIERRRQRSPINGIREEKTPTTSMETMSLEWVLRNPLIEEGVFGDACARTRNAYNLRLAFFFLLWILYCNLEPKFLLYLYYFLAILRLHNTMVTINLNSVKFYQPSSTIKSTNKNSFVIFWHIRQIAKDTRDENADMWNLALSKII